MSISNTTNRVSYTGNGSTTAFAVSFPFHSTADLVVIETIIATGVQAIKALTTDYTISGTTNDQGHYPNGGTVTALTAPASTVTWLIYRDPALTQSVDLVEGDPLPVDSSVEAPLDRAMMVAQRTRELVVRALRQPEGDATDIAILPPKITRASLYLAFDAQGDPIASAGQTSDPLVTAFMSTVLDDIDAGSALTTLGLSTYIQTLIDDANAAAARITLDAARNSAVNNFRLSLTSTLPITTADVTAAGTLYCIPYKGNSISLYDGTNWIIDSSAEFNLSLTLTSGKPYDIFCYDSSGIPTLEVLVWTNDTTRATALAYQDGVLIKSGDATRRYLGSLYSSGTDITEDSEANRYLWNYYNRTERSMKSANETNSWNYTTLAWRQANANTANQLNFIIGVIEDPINALLLVSVVSDTSTGIFLGVGIGLDSTTTPSTTHAIPGIASVTADEYMPLTATYRGYPTIGRHYLAWLEKSVASGTTTWWPRVGSSADQSGISGTIKG